VPSGRRTVTSVLTPMDDYPIHQTAQPIAVPASGDLNHYDRYFFNGYTRDGSLYFAAALGVYPNRQVIDASFSVVRWDGAAGTQVAVHASGRCPLDRTRTEVGPIRIEVVEPLQTLAVHVDAPEQGLRAVVTFRHRTVAVQEAPFHRQVGTRVVMDYTRLTQFGAWEGWVEVDGEHLVVSPSEVLGSRDRSWGIRGVGERVPGAPGPAPQFYWLWAPISFDSRCTHFDVNETADGRRWHEEGFVVPVGGGRPEAMADVSYGLEWKPGTRHAQRCSLRYEPHTGKPFTVELEPLYEFQMLGLGYFHPDWSHGVWKGEEAVGGTRLALPVPDPLALQNLHVQALCRARTSDGEEGIGILEQLVIGPHEPSGLHDLLDGAPDQPED
jgi:hypothetical protein